MTIFSETIICSKQSTRPSCRWLLMAIIVSGLSFALVTQGHANTASESFSPESLGASSKADSHTVPSGVLNGANYKAVKGHAVFENDIILGRVNALGNIQNFSARGLGKANAIGRWTNGIIPYQFSNDLSNAEISMAKEAILHWTENTTISMIERTEENRDIYEDYVTFEPSNGCTSYVGKQGGEQQLWVSAGCGVGSIIHEIGHTVGLFHEHTRSDRDNFISVNWENIEAEKQFNFEILNAGPITLGEYDYGSIMHYAKNNFSSNGAATITVLDGASEIGQRIALSEQDIRSVNSLYATDLAVALNTRFNETDGRPTTEVQVTNNGNMGARKIELILNAGEYRQWAAQTNQSDWNCTTRNAELICTLDMLVIGETSAFTVNSNANSSGVNTMSASLIAITQDTDYSNNTISETASAHAATASPDNNTTVEIGQALPQESTLNDSKDDTSNPFATAAESAGETSISEMNSASGGALSPAGNLILLIAGSVFFRLRAIVK